MLRKPFNTESASEKIKMKDLNYQKGKKGEEIAKNYLIRKGYQILKENFRTRLGEIDIIAHKRETLIFTEVKLKIGEDKGTPEEMINLKKINKIQQIAEIFLQNYPEIAEKFSFYRIDTICIVLNSDKSIKRINHWKNITL